MYASTYPLFFSETLKNITGPLDTIDETRIVDSTTINIEQKAKQK